MNAKMEAPKGSSLSRLEQLPDELKQMILACVQDVFSLKSAVLSCRSLYSSFLSAEMSITTHVLTDQIDSTILPDAIARQKSLSIDPLNYLAVGDFIETYYGKSVEGHQWDLRSALSIAGFHRLVLYYTDKFVLDAGTSFPALDFSPSQQHMPVSPPEMCRIQRAFYRYEIFCNIFRNEGHDSVSPFFEDFDGMKLQDIFLSKFAPWENEQLACAYTFLVDNVSPMYNEVVEHDVECGSREMEWGAYGITEDSGWFQFLLTTGLEHLRELICAKTYAQREKLVLRPYWREQFIRKAFKRINGAGALLEEIPSSDESWDCNTPLKYLTAEEKSIYITAPFFDDPDAGPATAWTWASWCSIPFDFVNCKHQKPLQGWGYVMWDIARLQKLPVFQRQFEHPAFNLRESRRQDQQIDQIHDEIRDINTAKKQIYKDGGRGWWSKDDQSRLVWAKVPKTGSTRKTHTMWRERYRP